jgi:DNA mismatch repair ATPase MutS
MEEHPERVRNMRFEVDILEDRLEFDYKLKPGISQNLNATFLMKKMGIME